MATVADLAVHFPGVTLLQSRLAPLSFEDYLADATLYLRFCEGKAKRIVDPQALLEWREYMVHHTTYSPNTINRRLMAIKAMVKASVKAERFDPAKALKFDSVEIVKLISLRHRLKQNARVRLEPEDVRRLCTLPDPTTMLGLRDRVLLNVLASTGCRILEAVNIERRDIWYRAKDKSYFVQVVGKGKTEPRQAPLSRQAYEWIQRWLSVRDALLPTCGPLMTAIEPYTDRPLGHRIQTDTARYRLKLYAEQAGLEHVTPHQMRRFVGTQLTERYGLRVAQLALGHASPDVTARFYVLDELPGGVTDGLF